MLNTALHLACEAGHDATARALIAEGAVDHVARLPLEARPLDADRRRRKGVVGRQCHDALDAGARAIGQARPGQRETKI